jgi:hypothetical protein
MVAMRKKRFQRNNNFANVVATLLLAVLFILDPGTGHLGRSIIAISDAQAAGGVVEGPNVIAPDRYVYYPGTEVLAKDEVRVIACGTGMPDARRDQAAACFLFEFGNGEAVYGTK